MPLRDHGRKRLIILILIMIVISLLGSFVSLFFTYQAAIQQQKDRLSDIVTTQKELIEAVARFDAINSTDAHPLGATAATLNQYFEAYKNYNFKTESGELVLGQMLRGQIRIILRNTKFSKGSSNGHIKNIPLDSSRAVPMQLALKGLSGNVVSIDYEGTEVVASYSPMIINSRKFGVVAKIDLEEIQAPYLNAVMAAFAVTFFLIIVGAVIFSREINPLIDELQKGQELLEIRVKNRTHELELAKEAAVEASKSKTLFLANMSHELRTPMNSVLGFVNLAIEDPILPPTLKKYLTTAHTSAASLLTLLNEILDISKLETKNFQLEDIHFQLPELVNSVMQIFQLKAEEKSLSLDLSIEPDIFHCRIGDPNRLKQILINLIGNSIKFTEEGNILLKVGCSDSTDRLHFQVIDTGIGIAEEDLHKIFDEFSQADASTTRKFGGTGLGTTISKKLVNLMGGKIWVESELGKGSCFHFAVNLPASTCLKTGVCVSDCDVYRQDVIATSKASRAFKILVADDVQANINLVTILLEKQGHQVDSVMNGEEALEKYKSGNYDVILMDVQMPIMDGLTASKKIREIEGETEHPIVIIALTASVLQEELNQYFEAGIDTVVSKPLDFRELFAAFDRYISDKKGTPIANALTDAHRAEEIMEASLIIPGIDFKKGVNTWQDEGKYKKAILGFIQENQNCLSSFTELFNEKQYIRLATLGNILKGVSGNLAMVELSKIAEMLEQAARSSDDSRIELCLKELTRQFSIVEKSASMLSYEEESIGQVEYEEELVTLQFKALLVALDKDEPTAGEKICEQLTLYLGVTALKQIKQHIELFDFRKAADAVYRLAEKIKIQIKD